MKIPPVRVVFGDRDKAEVLDRVRDILSTGMLAQGKYVKEFEDKWAQYVGRKHAVAVNSGTGAIEIAMRILDVGGREVLVPDNTFAATASAVVLAGGAVRLVDTDPATFAVTIAELKKRRTKRTVGVVVVHIGGIVTPEMADIRKWCDHEGLWLFEDCAHAHGSEWNGMRAGGFGVLGAYSFFATKVMTTGEGGAIVTDDDGLASRARLLRDHGKPEPWVSYHVAIGSNWRMSELHAAIGLSQLDRLDVFVEWRERIARLYTQWVKEIPQLEPVLPVGRSSWYKYIVLLPRGADRASVKKRMKELGVSLSGEVYETPLHRQPVFRDMAKGAFPIADDVCARHVCLPLYFGMEPDEARFVIDALKTVLAA